MVTALGRARAAEVERDGPHSFVVVGLARGPRFQDGDGPMADVIVEPCQHRRRRPGRLGLGRLLGQHGFEDTGQEKRLKQVAVGLMEQQVGVMRPVGRQDLARKPASATASAWPTSRKAPLPLSRSS